MNLDRYLYVTTHPADVPTDPDDHAEVLVDLDQQAVAKDCPTMADTLALHRWAAGVLGRLAVILAPQISHSAATHHCYVGQRYAGFGCYLTAEVEHFLDPATSLGAPLWLALSVPTRQETKWAKETRGYLAQILAADQWQPNAVDERRFIGEPEQLTLIKDATA